MEEEKNNQQRPETEISGAHNQSAVSASGEEVTKTVLTTVSGHPTKSRKWDWFWTDKSKLILPGAILLAAIMISGTLLYVNHGQSDGRQGTAQIGGPAATPSPKAPEADNDAFLGPKNASVTIIEFSDFQCLYCRKFWKETFEQLKKAYINTGKVRFVYRDFPLEFHEMSQASAEASECAKEQGKYWEMHDKMFAEQVKLGEGAVQYAVNDLKKWAAEIGLNAAKFNQCLDASKYKEEIADDFSDGVAAGVSGTPTFFINGKMLIGAQPFAQFKAIIDAELQK